MERKLDFIVWAADANSYAPAAEKASVLFDMINEHTLPLAWGPSRNNARDITGQLLEKAN